MPSLRVLSYGGGTQSAALALMAAAGDLPKLDAVVFADTQGELPEMHDSRIPLRDADLRDKWQRDVDNGQGDLFDGVELGLACEAGVCFT